LEELASKETAMISNEIYEFLHKSMIAGCNIVISGKGGSGKTTLMRNLINKIPENLSITSCEETAELYSTHPNIIQREILSNRNKEKNVTLETLTKHSLVMSNDCIVIGELKGEEAMSFFDAISTGHRGYATVHADSSKATIDRLITLMKRDIKAQMYTDKYLRKLLSYSLDLIVYMNNFKVQEIVEVDYDSKADDIVYNPLFEFEVEGYEKGKSIGKFKKIGTQKGRVKKKFELYKQEIERLM
jgi:pilus assembly protein CpaF